MILPHYGAGWLLGDRLILMIGEALPFTCHTNKLGWQSICRHSDQRSVPAFKGCSLVSCSATSGGRHVEPLNTHHQLADITFHQPHTPHNHA